MRTRDVIWITSCLLMLVAALSAVSAQQTPTSQPTARPTTGPVTLEAPSLDDDGMATALPSLSGVGGTAGEFHIAIRSGPGTAYRVIGVLRPGRSIDIVGTNGFDTDRGCGPDFQADLDMWVEVFFREQRGWMARCTLFIRGDLSRLHANAGPDDTINAGPRTPQPAQTPQPNAAG
ncbi:MAG: SH3 domain-containing protein [Chloroflexi bacterium]|nr:SH3 domain-containing protein [Chloroflexota bacterium]